MALTMAIIVNAQIHITNSASVKNTVKQRLTSVPSWKYFTNPLYKVRSKLENEN